MAIGAAGVSMSEAASPATGREPSAAALLEARGISKRFGTTVANDAIDLTIRPGEIHALLGENGAGKSTLVKILYGVLQPDAGVLLWEGKPRAIPDPNAARAIGIGMVFQHFSLFEALSVAENVALAMPPGISLKETRRRIEETAVLYGLPVAPDRAVHTLSVGERQRVEILRCLLQSPRLLIMDEPTSVLTPQEAEKLFETLRRLADEGCAILYITHRLEEVRVLCYRATVLRGGRVVAQSDPRTETARSLARMMVGAEVALTRRAEPPRASQPILVAENVSRPALHIHGTALENVSLSVAPGEILGIAGVAGNGQSELFGVLSGEVTSAPHAIRIDGRPVGDRDIAARRRLGAAFVPEERNGHAAVGLMRLSENVVLTEHVTGDVAPRGWIRADRARAVAQAIAKAFDVRRGAPDPLAATLSGGNLQKFVVGRAIIGKPRLLVVDQPTWGVDAGAAVAIRDAIVALAEAGSAVVVISQDLDELFEIAHRIAVMSEGRLSPPHDATRISREEIGILMGGGVIETRNGEKVTEARGAA